MSTPRWSVETNDPSCHRCRGSLYLLLRVPPELARWPAGALGEGTVRLVPLCPRCDRDEPSAQGLLAFFGVHQTISEENAADFAALVNEWVDQLPIPKTADPAAFERDVAAWHRGELDLGESLDDEEGGAHGRHTLDPPALDPE